MGNNIDTDMQSHMDNMMKGLNGLTGMLDGLTKNFAKDLTSEQALEFQKQFSDAKIEEKLKNIQLEHTKLKTELNID